MTGELAQNPLCSETSLYSLITLHWKLSWNRSSKSGIASSTVKSLPSSLEMDVTPLSGIPQGTMWENQDCGKIRPSFTH